MSRLCAAMSSGYHVWWYVFPKKLPVDGEYRVETSSQEGRITASTKLETRGALARSTWVIAGSVAPNAVEAFWSSVSDAISYGTAIVSSSAVFLPRDTSGPVPSHTYTTATFATLRRQSRSIWPHRVELYAFNVDLTRVPPELPAEFKASWALSPPFDFP